MNKRFLTLCAVALVLVVCSAGSAMAWGTASANCVVNTYGSGAHAGAAGDPLEVFYCNIFNALTGGIGASLAVCMLVIGIYMGAFGNGGVMSAVPFVLLGVFLGMADTIVGWMGVTTRVVPFFK